MPPKTLTAEQVAEIDRQQQPTQPRPVNWQSVIPQKEDVLTARVNRAARQNAPATLTAEQVDTAEAQNSVAAETSFGRAMGARPDRSAGPLAPGPKKVLSAREVQQINHDRVSDISYLPTMDEWREDQKFKAERDDSVGRFVEAGKAIAGGLFQAAAATAYAPFDFVARGTKAYDEWVNSSAEGIRQAGISTAELWSWAGDVVNDSVRETERVNVIDNQLRQRLAAENKFTGNAQADAQIFAQARERAMASGAYGKTQEQEADDENTQYQRFIRDRSFQQQAANITETNIGALPDGRAEMGIDASKLNPGLVTTTALVADPLNFALPIGFGAVNKLRVLRRVASLTGTPLRGAGKAAGAMAQGSENIYSRIVEGVEDATGIGEAGQAAAVSAVSWKAAAAMATLKGSGRVLRNVERGLETGSILAREIGIGGVGVSRVEAAKKLRYAPIPERYRRAYDGFFTSPDSTLRRISETPGLSPIARRSAATLDKLGATQVFRATDDALSGALATAPIAVPLAAIAPEERRPEILGALMTVGAGAGIVGGKVRRMSEFDDALVAKMLADADISGGDAASLANALPHDRLVNMARMQSVISAKADFIPLRAKDYALDTTVNEAMGLGTRGIHVDAQKGKRPRIYLNIDKIAAGDVAGHEIGHAIFRSNILGGEIKQGMRGMVDVQYGMDGIAARGREYVNSQLTQEVRDGTTGIQLNVLTPDEVQRIAAAGGDEVAEQALKQEFIRERWAKDADWRKQAIDERTDMLNQERLAQGETAWDWARDEIAAETFSGLGKGLNLSGIRASGPLGRAVGAAQATMEAMGARFKGNGRLKTPNQLFVENPLFDTPEMRKAVSNYVKTYDRYLVGLEKEGKIKQRGTPIAPTGKASDAARSPHTRTYANTKNGVTVVESDLFIERPDGTRVPKSQEMINTQEKARAATLKSINDRTKFAEREGDWGARKLSNGRVEVGGPTLPLQFDNFIQVPQWLRIKARDFEAGRAEGRSYLYSVNVIGSGESGTYKVKNLGNVEAKVGEMVPFGWAVSQKNHLLTKVIDLNSFRAATMRAIDNEQLGEFGNDLRAVEAGLKQMLRNYQDGNPGETGLGVTKKNILNGLLGTGTVTQRQNNPAWYTLNNQGSVRTFRFDRLNYADPYGTGYFPHYNKININALPDDAGRMSMDSYRQFDADRKVAWMNKEAAKRGYSNATNWQGADAQGFQAADAQYRQEFPTESMPQQIPREAQGMPDAPASGKGDGMPNAPRRYVSMEKFIEEAGDDLGEVLPNAYRSIEFDNDDYPTHLVSFSDARNSMYRSRVPSKEFFDWLHSDKVMDGLVFDKEYTPARPGEGAGHTRESYQAVIDRLRDISLRKPKPSAAPRGQAMPDADYRGEHSAPDRQSGAPLHKVTDNGIYPADVYSAEGARLYGTGEDAMDRAAFNMISSLQDKPNASVRVYRAVPRNEAPSELVYKYQRQKDQILRTGKIPKEAEGQWKNSSEYYDWLDKEMARLKEMPDAPKERLGIESGDWVTPIRKYAEDHGKSALRNQYKVVSKLVKARDVFTAGDSWLEWGYDPAK
jgi:hypothetical protein